MEKPPRKSIRKALLIVASVALALAGGAWAWHEAVAVQAAHEQAGKARAAAEQARSRDERIEHAVAEARRVLEELPLPDFWPVASELWRAKQVTVAGELQRPLDKFRGDLAACFNELSPLTQQPGQPARQRWEQAADVAFALFRLPQAEQAYRKAAALADRARDARESFRLNQRVGDVLHAAQRFEEERQLRDITAVLRENSGQADPAPIASAVRMALCDRQLGRLPEAIALMQGVLKEPLPVDADHQEVLVALAVRSFLFRVANQPDACEADIRRVLAESERIFGKDDARVAIASSRLTVFLISTHRLVEAAPLGRRAVDLCEKNYGGEHPLTMVVLRALAKSEFERGAYDQAEALMRHNLEIDEKSLPAEHPSIAADCAGLAALYAKTNRFAESQQLLRRAFAIYERVYGAKAAETEGCRRSLAVVEGSAAKAANAGAGASSSPSSLDPDGLKPVGAASNPGTLPTAAADAKEEAPLSPEQARHIERWVTAARRILEEMPLFEIWIASSDLWRVKQITVAAELPLSVPDLQKDLAAGYDEICAVAPHSGPLARQRWEQAGEVAFALFRLPEAEHCYTRGIALADGAGDHAGAVRLEARIADVFYAAGRFEDERLQRESIATQREAGGLADPSPLMTAVRTALCLRARRRLPDALATMESVLKGQSGRLDPKNPDLTVAVAMRYTLYRDTHQAADKVEAEARRIVSACETAYGKSDVHTIVAAGRLAHFLAETQRWTEALEIVRRLQPVLLKQYGPGHPLSIWNDDTIAFSLMRAGRYQDAESILQQSLEAREKYLPPEHRELADNLGALGFLAEKTDRLAEAQRLYRGALDIYKKALGPKASETKNFQSQLASVEARLAGGSGANVELAGPFQPEALQSLEYSPATIARLSNLGSSFFEAGRLTEAELCARRAVELEEKAGAGDKLDGVGCRRTLGLCLHRKAQYAEAEAQFRHALATQQKILGMEHPDLVFTLDCLAGTLFAENRPTEAENVLRRAIALCVASGREQSNDMTATMDALANHLQLSGRYADTLPLLRKVVENIGLNLGNKHEYYGEALNKLAVSLAAVGRLDEAGRALDEAVALGEKLPSDYAGYPNWIANLGALHFRREEKTQGDALYQRALGILYRRSKVAGYDLPDLQKRLEEYSAFLRQAGFSQEKIAGRLTHLRQGEEVPAL